MFCSKCGKEQEDARFCRNCGKPLFTEDESEQVVAEEFLQTTEDCWQKVTRIVRMLVLAALIFIFFPFVMFSCSGTEVEISGAEIMTTITFKEELSSIADSAKPNVFLVITEIAGLLALISFIRTRNEDKLLTSGFFSAIAAIGLIVFRATFNTLYELDSYVEVEFRWGFVLCLLSYIAAAALSLYSVSKYSEHSIAENIKWLFGGGYGGIQSEVLQELKTENSEENKNPSAQWTCPKCQYLNRSQHNWCRECGHFR